MTLLDAEEQALQTSHRLAALSADERAAQSQANAQRTELFPKLFFQGNFNAYATIPQVSFIRGQPPINFGNHTAYSIGPVLNYSLWDNSAAGYALDAATALQKARGQDREQALLQTLLAVRSSYVRLQLALDELRLIQQSLDVATAQKRDVQSRFRAGASSRLDLVDATRAVLSNEIAFTQRQAELADELRDFLALTGKSVDGDASHPGPQGVQNVSLTLKLDALSQTLEHESRAKIEPPNDLQPLLQSQALQVEAFRLNAKSQSAKRLPSIQVTGGVTYNLPNIPNPPRYWQQSLGFALMMPLFIGDPLPHLAAQQRSLALAAEERRAQAQVDLLRDFQKASERLQLLQVQKRLVEEDVVQTSEAARLYYQSFQAGRLNYVDVQNANVRSLAAQVNSARIDAQMLGQIVLLKALSGREGSSK